VTQLAADDVVLVLRKDDIGLQRRARVGGDAAADFRRLIGREIVEELRLQIFVGGVSGGDKLVHGSGGI
jgi:hypothetical protein